MYIVMCEYSLLLFHFLERSWPWYKDWRLCGVDLGKSWNFLVQGNSCFDQQAWVKCYYKAWDVGVGWVVVVEFSRNQALIDSKLVYKLKYNPASTKAKIFKAKLMTRGFTHEKSMNYNKVIFLVAKYITICPICALVAIFSLVMDYMDMVTTFSYGYLE